MAFTNDQSNLNSMNLDLINQYMQSINALQPLMLQQSGYQKVTSPDNISQKTSDSLKQAQADLALFNKGVAGQKLTADESAQYLKVINQYSGYSRWDNSNQWGDARDKTTTGINQAINNLQNQSNNEQVGYQLTPEAKANQDAYKQLASTQLKQLQDQATYLNSDAYKAQVAQQQQISDLQQKNTLALQQKAQDALSGNYETSPILKKQISDSFQQFKDAQAKAGNIILGDSIDNAVGKGSAATESLAAFQNNVNASKQNEINAVINQQIPLSMSGAQASSALLGGLNLNNTGQYASTTFNQAYGTPAQPNYSGLSQMTLAAQQPYQFDQQLYMQQQQMNAAQQAQTMANRSGLLSGGMQLAGTIGGAFLGGPMGAGIGSQVGGQLGGSTALPYGYSPQFGNVGSPTPGMRP